jgi:hypothetical protein
MNYRWYKPKSIILDEVVSWNDERIADCRKCIHCWKCIYAFQGGRDCSSFRRRAGIRKRSNKKF